MNALAMTVPDALRPKTGSASSLMAARDAASATPSTESATRANALEPVGAVLEHAAASIHRFVYIRAGGDANLIDDIMQQLWIAARKGPALERGAAEAWLRGAARNLIANHWRGVARRPVNLPLPDLSLAAEMAQRMTDPHVPLEVLGRSEARNQLLLALTELESADQDLLVRFYFTGQPQAQLAQELGVSERAIEGRLYRARQALRKRLAQLET